jgi:hypothetical protein
MGSSSLKYLRMRKLDAGADLGEALRALENGDGTAASREAQRGGQPADPAADDQRLGDSFR